MSTLHLHFGQIWKPRTVDRLLIRLSIRSVLQRLIFGRVRALRCAKPPDLQHFEAFGAFQPFGDDMPIHWGAILPRWVIVRVGQR